MAKKIMTAYVLFVENDYVSNSIFQKNGVKYDGIYDVKHYGIYDVKHYGIYDVKHYGIYDVKHYGIYD
jgi:hypothetical protein